MPSRYSCPPAQGTPHCATSQGGLRRGHRAGQGPSGSGGRCEGSGDRRAGWWWGTGQGPELGGQSTSSMGLSRHRRCAWHLGAPLRKRGACQSPTLAWGTADSPRKGTGIGPGATNPLARTRAGRSGRWGLAAPAPSCKDWGCASCQGIVSSPLSAGTIGATTVFWCWCANQGEHRDCHTVARGSCRLQCKAHG